MVCGHSATKILPLHKLHLDSDSNQDNTGDSNLAVYIQKKLKL